MRGRILWKVGGGGEFCLWPHFLGPRQVHAKGRTDAPGVDGWIALVSERGDITFGLVEAQRQQVVGQEEAEQEGEEDKENGEEEEEEVAAAGRHRVHAEACQDKRRADGLCSRGPDRDAEHLRGRLCIQ